MSQFVISKKLCGASGHRAALTKLTYSRPFQYNDNTYYKPHTVYGGIGSSCKPNIWRKIYRKC